MRYFYLASSDFFLSTWALRFISDAAACSFSLLCGIPLCGCITIYIYIYIFFSFCSWTFALFPVSEGFWEKLLNTLAISWWTQTLASLGCRFRGACWVMGWNPGFTRKAVKEVADDPEGEMTCSRSHGDSWGKFQSIHPPRQGLSPVVLPTFYPWPASSQPWWALVRPQLIRERAWLRLPPLSPPRQPFVFLFSFLHSGPCCQLPGRWCL